MLRRSFLSWLGLGWIVTRLAGCGGQTKVNAQDGFQAVGTVSDLKQKGQLLVEQSPNPILVIRDPGNAVVAVNPTCTHQGCLVNWKPDQKAFVCPCHGAKFSSDGKVTNPPAQKALATYAVKVDGDKISVKAE